MKVVCFINAETTISVKQLRPVRRLLPSTTLLERGRGEVFKSPCLKSGFYIIATDNFELHLKAIMTEQRKPIKRSSQLAPLSREHHEGLLFVWKLRQGISKNIEAARITAFMQWFWQEHLEPHFEKEENALPAVLPPAHPMMQQMYSEHGEIKKLIAVIAKNGNYETFEIVARTVNDHIRFEERQLYGEVEKTASPEQLQHLSEQLKDEPNRAVWEDEFWI
jgi:hemerythrin-like domain-containing protein